VTPPTKTAAERIARNPYSDGGGIGLRAQDAIGIRPMLSVAHADLPALLASVHWSHAEQDDADLVGAILSAVARDLRMLYTRRPVKGTRAERIARARDRREVLFNCARRADVAAEIGRRLLVGLTEAQGRIAAQDRDRHLRCDVQEAARTGAPIARIDGEAFYVVRERPNPTPTEPPTE